jgi:serine/threonine-protein kinase
VNPEAVARFVREARAAAKIKNEHVARVTDVGQQENGAPYMVMEYLEGSDLSRVLLERGPLPFEQAVDFILQACEALAEAHSIGIVHRDLKPANLFCVEKPDGGVSIKVLDFGISKVVSSESTDSMTRTSATLGSPLYMSPEQMQRAKGVDARTDLWALGIILFELLTGKPAFDGVTLTELVFKIATEAPRPLRELRPDAPEGLERVITRCLEKSREARFQTVAELANALRDFASIRGRLSIEGIEGVLRRAGISNVAATALAGSNPEIVSPGPAFSNALSNLGRETEGSWDAGGTGSRSTGRTIGAIAALATGVLMLGLLVFFFFGRRTIQAVVVESGLAPSPTDASRDPTAPPATSERVPATPPAIATTIATTALATAATSTTVPAPAVATSIPPAAQKRALAATPVAAPQQAAPVPPAQAKAAGPCKLTKTLDANSDPHFSCPCATCQ